VLIAGVIAFAATSLLCALAPNSAVLIIGRLLQGAAAAAVLPTVQSLINSRSAGPPWSRRSRCMEPPSAPRLRSDR
jgi:MFS family permease